jgi:hypothetical protein
MKISNPPPPFIKGGIFASLFESLPAPPSVGTGAERQGRLGGI